MTDYTAIPEKMRQAQRWLLWQREGSRKVPHYVDGNKRGTTDTRTDAARLANFDEAQAALRAGTGKRWAGLGFALGPDGAGGHWQGVDYDHQPPERVAELLADSPGYVEASPSGEGVHLIGYGPHFKSLAEKDGNGTGVEAYASGRYFTVTGAQGRGEVEDLAEYVGTVVAPLAAAIRASKGNPMPAPGQGASDDLDGLGDALAREPLTAEQVHDLRAALGHLDADSYDVWIDMGQALCKKGERGRELWMQWGATSAKFDEGEAAAKWDTFTGERTGIGAVFKAAEALGWVNPKKGGKGPQPVPEGIILTRASDLRIEPVAWLWDGWLARGKMHLLAGAPGQGKTTIALSLAATVTIGGHWPDGTRCAPGNVLMYSGEDDPADTLAPRLLAAGADLSRVRFISGTRIDGEIAPFDPARDLALLRSAVEKIGGVDLLIVDPIVGAVTGDSHKNTETRRGLQPLVDLAAACRCALIGITHFSKGGQGTDPAMRVIGSVAFTALARVVMVAAKVKGEAGAPGRVLARAKSNIGPDGGGFGYHLEQCDVAEGIEASRIGWGAPVEGTARELLTDPDADTEGEAETGDAVETLRGELAADSWTPVAEAVRALAALGFTKKQVRTARGKLAVICKKGGFKDVWYWRLPGGDDPAFPTGTAQGALESAEGAQGAHVLKRASWAPSGEKGTLGVANERAISCESAVFADVDLSVQGGSA